MKDKILKPEYLIRNNSLSNIVVSKDESVVYTPIALTAVNMARIEEKQKAIEAYKKTCSFNDPECCECKNDEGECDCETFKNFVASIEF